MNLAERTEVFAKLRIILMNLSLDELDDMAYLAASDNRWFVKKNINGEYESFFLHYDNQGQYSENFNNIPLLENFLEGYYEYNGDE